MTTKAAPEIVLEGLVRDVVWRLAKARKRPTRGYLRGVWMVEERRHPEIAHRFEEFVTMVKEELED